MQQRAGAVVVTVALAAAMLTYLVTRGQRPEIPQIQVASVGGECLNLEALFKQINAWQDRARVYDQVTDIRITDGSSHADSSQAFRNHVHLTRYVSRHGRPKIGDVLPQVQQFACRSVWFGPDEFRVTEASPTRIELKRGRDHRTYEVVRTPHSVQLRSRIGEMVQIVHECGFRRVGEQHPVSTTRVLYLGANLPDEVPVSRHLLPALLGTMRSLASAPSDRRPAEYCGR